MLTNSERSRNRVKEKTHENSLGGFRMQRMWRVDRVMEARDDTGGAIEWKPKSQDGLLEFHSF